MQIDIDSIKWNETGLIPCIAQDYKSGDILMLAYMNKEAINLSMKTRIAHYYSRSKKRIWKKGEQSGNTQEIKEMLIDCDNDTLLIKVLQQGVACHTGNKTCFFRNINDINTTNSNDSKIATSPYNALDTLYHNILNKKNTSKDTSYTALLFSKGDNAIAKKIIEESGELCFALKDNIGAEIIHECADLFYHVLVGLAYHSIDIDRIYQELIKRMGISGIEEKGSRKK